MRTSTLRRHAVNVNDEWPLHPDVSRSGRASVQLNGYRIGWRWKKISWEFRCLKFRIMPPLNKAQPNTMTAVLKRTASDEFRESYHPPRRLLPNNALQGVCGFGAAKSGRCRALRQRLLISMNFAVLASRSGNECR
jgi:hypothetical protein